MTNCQANVSGVVASIEAWERTSDASTIAEVTKNKSVPANVMSEAMAVQDMKQYIQVLHT